MSVPVRSSVVVVTGASSGIGLATALRFARAGACVVLAARRADPLEKAAARCREAGGRAIAVPADVTDENAVRELAAAAVREFGRLDTWVNNAGVTLLATVEDAPMDEFRRVIETDLFGYVHGARAALPHFREQGTGVLINNASMVATLAQPYAGAYVAAKHAVRGLGMTLRQELALTGGKDIHVCTVMPAVIDTPFFRHAGNRTGRRVRAMPPVYPPERVARTIVNLARWPRREVYVGTAARLMACQYRMAPAATERLLATLVDRTHLYRDRPAPPTPGNIREPMPEGTGADDGWHGRRGTAIRRTATAGLAAGAAAAAVTARRAAR